jgi:hypothetical protein
MLTRFLFVAAAAIAFCGCSQPGISPSWADLSFEVDQPGGASDEAWSGFTDYGTPVQINEHTVAIIERRKGIEFALWHLDFSTGTLRFITSLNNGKTTPHGFDEVIQYRDDSDVIAEFVFINIAQTAPNRFAGESLIGELNLQTGAAKVKKDKVKYVASEEMAREKLLDKCRSRDKSADLPTPRQVKNVVEESLSKLGLSFDYQRGRLVLAAEVRAKLRQAVRELGKDDSHMLSDIRALQNLLSSIPSCPATRELSNQLNLAAARAQ